LPKLKPEELEARRQEIITAARACFLRTGFHKSTTDEICHEASITPGGLYHYFDSKEDIILAVIDQSAHRVAERLRGMIEGSSDAKGLYRDVSTFFSGVMLDPDLDSVVRLDIEIWSEALKNEKLAEITKRSWALRRQMLEALVRRGIDEGLYNSKTADPRALASLFLGIFIGLRIQRLLWSDEFDVHGALQSFLMMHAGRLAADLSLDGITAK
jgi:AcrR family transcriptional regulator